MSKIDLVQGLRELDEARDAYNKALEYYEGTADEKFTSSALAQALGSESDEFNFNYAKKVVESRLSRIEVSSITTQDGSADDVLADIWNDNSLDAELQDCFEACLTFGDAYLIVWPGEDGTEIFYNSPLDTRVFYTVENPRKKDYAIKRWEDDDKLRVNVYYADRIEKYISKGALSYTYTEADFEEYYEEEQEAWPLVNETGEIPVFHMRTARQYGKPEHRSAYGPQDAINKLIHTQMSSMDFTSAPQRYMLEDPTANDGINAAADFGEIDDDDDPTAGLKATPGGVWNLKGIKSVGQFDPTPPDTFVVPFKNFIEALSTVSSTPLHAFNVGALPSGESLRAAEAPLNKRVANLELGFGAVLRELHEYALLQYGFDTDVIVKFAPPATYDDADIWETVKLKTAAGVPMRIALVEAGYTDEQVSEWYPEEETTARTGAELTELANSLQKISAAVSLGLITKEEARRLLPQDFLLEQEVADPESVIEAVNNSFIPDSDEE